MEQATATLMPFDRAEKVCGTAVLNSFPDKMSWCYEIWMYCNVMYCIEYEISNIL